MNPTSTRNLTPPWDTEIAKIMGKKGGKVKSTRKRLACKINPLKTGIYSKDKDIQKIINPTSSEKFLGIDRLKKVDKLKRLNSFFGSKNIIQCFDGLELDICLLQSIVLDINLNEKCGMTLFLSYFCRMIELKFQYLDRRYGDKSIAKMTNSANDLSTIMGRFFEEKDKINENQQVGKLPE